MDSKIMKILKKNYRHGYRYIAVFNERVTFHALFASNQKHFEKRVQESKNEGFTFLYTGKLATFIREESKNIYPFLGGCI